MDNTELLQYAQQQGRDNILEELRDKVTEELDRMEEIFKTDHAEALNTLGLTTKEETNAHDIAEAIRNMDGIDDCSQNFNYDAAILLTHDSLHYWIQRKMKQ